MKTSKTKMLLTRSLLAGAIFGLVLTPIGATAFMRSIDDEQIIHLDRMSGTNFMEHYAHSDIEEFGFTGIYFEPVRSEIPAHRLYDQDIRPSRIDNLAVEFHDMILATFEDSGLLTSTPTATTLVISTTLTDVQRFTADRTGTHLANVPPDNRERGGATMEMVWRAGSGGEIVLAIRDGRQPEIYDPVTDQNDRMTDIRDAFGVWTDELAFFFAISDPVPTN